MFGIILCSGCGRHRIINLDDKETKCPYCDTKAKTEKKIILFSDSNQSVVRDMLSTMSGVSNDKKKMDENIDPLSSLAYKVEHTSDLNMKMQIISEGLTKIKGTFTIDDVDELVPGKGEKYVKAMLAECMIHEVGYGKYSA